MLPYSYQGRVGAIIPIGRRASSIAWGLSIHEPATQRQEGIAKAAVNGSPVPRTIGGFAAAIDELSTALPLTYKRFLTRAPEAAFTNADVTACLLGRDLWFASLARFRDWLIESDERPHLWTFAFKASCLWDTSTWNRLSLDAKTTRARAGAVNRSVATFVSPTSLRIGTRAFKSAVDELAARGVYDPIARTFEPVADAQALETDLALVQIVSHWLVTLRHRERILADVHATGFEVHGYAEACSLCTQHWGLRTLEARWAPPFHPGCRCYAQPRFTA